MHTDTRISKCYIKRISEYGNKQYLTHPQREDVNYVGQFHRIDGPASIEKDGIEKYYIRHFPTDHRQQYTKESFLELTSKSDFLNSIFNWETAE